MKIKAAGCAPDEYVRGVALVDEEWSQANGLLNANLKKVRPAFRDRFADLIDGLFESADTVAGAL